MFNWFKKRSLLKSKLDKMRAEKLEDLLNDVSCPVCGYYCLGKGGSGCIDKPTLLEPVSLPKKVIPGRDYYQVVGGSEPTTYQLYEAGTRHIAHTCSCRVGKLCPWQALIEAQFALEKQTTQTESKPEAPDLQTSSHRMAIQPSKPPYTVMQEKVKYRPSVDGVHKPQRESETLESLVEISTSAATEGSDWQNLYLALDIHTEPPPRP